MKDGCIDLDEMLSEIADLEKENARLKEINAHTLSQLNIDNGELIIENERLKKENAELKKDNEGYEKDNARLVQQYNDLQKENAELKADNDARKFAMAMSEKVEKQLREENAKWKDEWQEQVQKATDEGYARTLQTIQLTKAKEIIEELSKSLFLAKGIVRDLIDDTVDFKESKERATYCYKQEKFDAYKKAEQFISEVEK